MEGNVFREERGSFLIIIVLSLSRNDLDWRRDLMVKIRIDLTYGDIVIEGKSEKSRDKIFLKLSREMENKGARTITLDNETIINKDHIIRIIKEKSE